MHAVPLRTVAPPLHRATSFTSKTRRRNEETNEVAIIQFLNVILAFRAEDSFFNFYLVSVNS